MDDQSTLHQEALHLGESSPFFYPLLIALAGGIFFVMNSLIQRMSSVRKWAKIGHAGLFGKVFISDSLNNNFIHSFICLFLFSAVTFSQNFGVLKILSIPSFQFLLSSDFEGQHQARWRPSGIRSKGIHRETIFKLPSANRYWNGIFVKEHHFSPRFFHLFTKWSIN
jgi:hypothetical protein